VLSPLPPSELVLVQKSVLEWEHLLALAWAQAWVQAWVQA